MYPYIPHTDEDIKKMLEVVGVDTVDDLFKDIDPSLRLDEDLDLKESMSELDIARYFSELAENKDITDYTCFLGAGAYDHYIPSIVKHIISRSEFYTSYTPYQAELSQGTLQYIFEYQTLITKLTGMDVSNASLYDGGTAIAEAAFMAANVSRREKILISESVHPESRQVLKTYAHTQGLEIVEVKEKDGVTDVEDLEEKMSEDIAAVIVQSPNYFGIIEDLEEIEKVAHSQRRTMLVASIDPISLGILKKPAELGVDIVVGEGQSLGLPLNFGGPYLGFIATNKRHMRKLPGRIVGQTIDEDDKRSFVLTLQAREQHIRREKATSNICTNQGINTLASTVYMVALGKKGLKEVAVQSAQKAHYTYKKIIESGKYKPLFDKPFFKEFAITSDIKPENISKGLLEEKILGGHSLGKDYPQYENGVLFSVTEKRTKEEIDKLVEVLEGIE